MTIHTLIRLSMKHHSESAHFHETKETLGCRVAFPTRWGDEIRPVNAEELPRASQRVDSNEMVLIIITMNEYFYWYSTIGRPHKEDLKDWSKKKKGKRNKHWRVRTTKYTESKIQ